MLAPRSACVNVPTNRLCKPATSCQCIWPCRPRQRMLPRLRKDRNKPRVHHGADAPIKKNKKKRPKTYREGVTGDGRLEAGGLDTGRVAEHGYIRSRPPISIYAAWCLLRQRQGEQGLAWIQVALRNMGVAGAMNPGLAA